MFASKNKNASHNPCISCVHMRVPSAFLEDENVQSAIVHYQEEPHDHRDRSTFGDFWSGAPHAI